MSLTSIRGALLEEAILYLLEEMGYSVIRTKNGDPQLRDGSSGLEIQGRGMWHQVDALAVDPTSLPFAYPIRLIVEAKCYQKPVGIAVVRNLVGVLKDVSENFTSSANFNAVPLKNVRFNYVAAVFSTSGFTDGTIRYALAHQIFLIQYKHASLFVPINEKLLSICESDFIGRSYDQIKGSYKARNILKAMLRREPANARIVF